jgi:murein DD-endopeptidase MepM/ murein hydrolase activator NlpD
MRRSPLALLLTLAAPAIASATGLTVSPRQAHPGDVVLIAVQKDGDTCPSGQLGEREVPFFRFASRCLGLVALPVEQPAGELGLRVGELKGSVEVLPARFNQRELTVASKFVQPPAQVLARMERDKQAFAQAFAQPFGENALFLLNFELPLKSTVTAPFGDQRVFNGKQQSQHYGMDLDGRIGDPVTAANDGVVVMARDNYASGRTVVLHHGGDLYTTYFHLSAMAVKKGERVKRGDRIGLVGSTGRVTGPHLHWGVKVGGIYADPASLLKVDFESEDAPR